MSTSFDEILGMGASSPGYYVPTGSPSGSYFPSFEGSMGFEGVGGQALKMEETLDFSSSQAALSFGDVLGGAGVDLPDVIFPLLLPPSSSSVGVVPSVKPEKAVTPLTFMEEEEEEEEEEGNPKWELELEHLISELDEGKMANLLDKKVEEELLHAPVKDFNKRTKAMKLGEEIKNVLKLKRKRMRNKQAATRSRARKETHVVELQAQVDQLLREKEEQLLLIRHLQQRTEMLERELVKARAPRPSA